jgi:ABC-type branched-subunit amino acid transport system substrate-binding protein
MSGRFGAALVATVALLAMAVGWAAPAASTVPATGNGHTYTIGLMIDETGLAASSYKTFAKGVAAGIAATAGQGYHFRLVTADTGSLPNSALSAAQKLVEEDHAFAVIAGSSLVFGASTWLTAHGIPLIGGASDGPEWLHAQNMFSVYGRPDPTKVATPLGQFLKMEGASNLASVGYSISPLSAEAAESQAASARAAGLKIGYLNANFPFGSTNVQPVALAMKSAGANSLYAAVEPSTALALVTAARQEGITLKGAVLATGYGADLLQGGNAAVQAAQGVDFQQEFEPVEMHNAATQRMLQALKKVGVRGDPSYAEDVGYTSVGLLVRGLQAAGSNPTQASFIRALSHVKNWNAMGLLGKQMVDMSLNGTNVFGPGECIYMTQLRGSSFHLIPKADPICGHVIPGKTVSPP